MKRLNMTPELIADIQAAVGQDVDPSGFAVFEVISLNSMPLPGKDGTIFEKAKISMLTLQQMADNINGGNHLPLIFNHDMSGIPVGRVFKAKAVLNQTSGEVELRSLFYVDDTNPELARKIDAGSLDEVSVQFLSSQILCSECDFDYRGLEASWKNFYDRTCENGHTIGKDGVHARLVGLQQFTELSLVTRGAANNPKIVGKSDAKLTASLAALSARGFEVDQLIITASKGEYEVDLTAVLAQLDAKTTAAAQAEVKLTAVTGERDAAISRADTAEARVAELEASAAAAAEAGEADVTALTAERDEAKTILTDIYSKLAVAAGVEGAAPETIADLKAGIEKHQSKLTAMIPVGGAAATTQNEAGAKFNADLVGAFKTNR